MIQGKSAAFRLRVEVFEIGSHLQINNSFRVQGLGFRRHRDEVRLRLRDTSQGSE